MTFATGHAARATALAAIWALAPFTAFAAPGPNPTPGRIVIRAGQTPQQALLEAQRTVMPRQSGAAAPAMPAITQGTLLSRTLDVGKAASLPVVRFGYTVNASGLSYAQFRLASPSGKQSLQLEYLQGPHATSGVVTFLDDARPSGYAEPGLWTLQSASVSDLAGNYTSYTAEQLAGLFEVNQIEVVNAGAFDNTAPQIVSGKVLTPTVSLSSPRPEFKASLKVTDDLAGANTAYVYVMAPGNTYGQASFASQTRPVKTGTLKAFSDVAGGPTGTWQIVGYTVCDVAGNCLDTASVDDVLAVFGTSSFEVTD